MIIVNKSELEIRYDINEAAYLNEKKIKLDSKETLNLYLNLKADFKKNGIIIIDHQKFDIDLSKHFL